MPACLHVARHDIDDDREIIWITSCSEKQKYQAPLDPISADQICAHQQESQTSDSTLEHSCPANWEQGFIVVLTSSTTTSFSDGKSISP